MNSKLSALLGVKMLAALAITCAAGEARAVEPALTCDIVETNCEKKVCNKEGKDCKKVCETSAGAKLSLFRAAADTFDVRVENLAYRNDKAEGEKVIERNHSVEVRGVPFEAKALSEHNRDARIFTNLFRPFVTEGVNTSVEDLSDRQFEVEFDITYLKEGLDPQYPSDEAKARVEIRANCLTLPAEQCASRGIGKLKPYETVGFYSAGKCTNVKINHNLIGYDRLKQNQR